MTSMLNKLLLAEALNEMGIIHSPGSRRKHWSIAFYMENYGAIELKFLYNKRADRMGTCER